MTPGQQFILILAFLFCFSAYSTVRLGMIPFFAMITAAMWLGIGVGCFIKIGLDVFK